MEGWASPSGLKEEHLKKSMRREPLQLLLWTPRQLHLIQPGRQAAADMTYLRSLRARSEHRPKMDPSWVKSAYEDFWGGREGSSASAGEDRRGSRLPRSESEFIERS